MKPKGAWFAGQPSMIEMWLNRASDYLDAVAEKDEPDEDIKKLAIAEQHEELLEMYLYETLQLQQNVRRLDEPIHWKFKMSKYEPENLS